MDLITNSYVVELALTVGKIMLVVGPLLIAVAYLTLAERRVIGFMQLFELIETFPVFLILPFFFVSYGVTKLVRGKGACV